VRGWLVARLIVLVLMVDLMMRRRRRVLLMHGEVVICWRRLVRVELMVVLLVGVGLLLDQLAGVQVRVLSWLRGRYGAVFEVGF
jgi:hypothetical protein